MGPTLSRLLVHPTPRIREISAAAITNMMARPDDVEFVLRSLPNILDLLERVMQPPTDEATMVNVRYTGIQPSQR